MRPAPEPRGDGGGTYENVAQGNATVGFQAGTIYGGVHYRGSESDSPEQKYTAGRRALERGVPRRAEDLIGQAVDGGHVSTEVAYQWVLSILSGRSFDELQQAQFESLQQAFKYARNEPEDGWSRAVRVIGLLLDHLMRQERPGLAEGLEASPVREEYGALDQERKDDFRRHLDNILVGALRDDFASREKEEAEAQRMDADREGRAWKFFAATPVPPEPLPLPPDPPRVGAWLTLTIGAVLILVGLISALPVLVGQAVWTLAALCLAVAGLFGVVHYDLKRQVARDRVEDEGIRLDHPLDEDGRWEPRRWFDNSVRSIVKGAFAAHDPVDEEGRRLWRAETEGIQMRLTRELAEAFRDRDVRPGSVSYLARWHAESLAARWSEKGRFRGLRSRLAIPLRVYLGLALGTLTMCAGAAWAWTILWRHGGLVDYMLLPAAIALGVDIACEQGGSIYRERRRAQYACEYRDRRYRDECDAYRRWCAMLAGRPTDQEMARWLDLDKRYLRAKAMELYGLANREVVAHLVLCEDAPNCKRAQMPGGAMRYTAYLISVLLMTDWGVRLAKFHVDFLTGEYTERSRTVFRYEGVASAQVTQVWVKTSGTHRRIIPLDQENEDRPEGWPGLRRNAFRVSLVNAQPITVLLEAFQDELDGEVGGEEQQQEIGKDWAELEELALDSSGVAGALHVMEAITADGKQWLEYEAERRKRRLHDLGIGSFLGDD